jgi:hypothetical protein
MHHLELNAVEDVDDEVASWLLEAAAHSGRPGRSTLDPGRPVFR